MMNIVRYSFLIIFVIFIIFGLLYEISIIIALIKKKAPAIHSGIHLQRAVINEIKLEFPNAKTILDIGSGWGGMVRSVARSFQNAKVTGIEIMRMPYLYSKLCGLFVKNSEIHFGDAFKYLKQTNKKFDIGITYLLPFEMKNVADFKTHFKVLFVLDFPLPNSKPDKKIKLHRGALGQHWLYVYNNEK